jgi:kynurenine formamidase
VRIPPDRLIGQGVLLDLSDMIGPGQQIDAEHFNAADPGVEEGDIVFVRTDITDWYYYGADVNIGITPGLSPDAARWLVDRRIRALVLDCPSVERSDPLSSTGLRHTSNKIHYLLHRNDIPIVEWACRFRHLRKSRFLAAILALPVSHQGGFPAHLMAIEDWD